MRALVIAAIFILLIIRPTASFASDDDSALKDQLRVIDSALIPPDQKIEDPTWLVIMQGGKDASDQLGRMWHLLESRSSQFLGESGSQQRLAEMIQDLGPYHADVIPFDDTATLINIAYRDATADVFIVSGQGIQKHVSWRLSNDLITPADVKELSDTVDGGHIFYVETGTFQMAGCDTDKHLSIWKYVNSRTKQVLTKQYPTYCDGDPPRFDRDVLRIQIKRPFKNVWVAASAPGRETDWQIAVGPNGIEDKGEIPERPELDLLDQVIGRLVHKMDARQLASKKVIAVLREQLVGPETSPIELDTGITRNAPNSRFCVGLGTPSVDASYRFTTRNVGKTLFLSDVEQRDQCPP